MTNTELYLYAKAKNGSGGGSSDAEQMLKGIIERNSVELVIPNGVTTIGSFVFYLYESLTSVTIPNSVTTINNFVFEECESLTNLTIPNSVTTIGECAFSRCTSLESVTIGNGFNADRLDLSCSTLYSVDTLVDILNALADRTGLSAYNLRLGSTNLEKLSNEQIAVATEKNWILW